MRRWIALLLVCVMAFGLLTACGKEDANKNNQTTEPSAEGGAPTETQASDGDLTYEPEDLPVSDGDLGEPGEYPASDGNLAS